MEHGSSYPLHSAKPLGSESIKSELSTNYNSNVVFFLLCIICTIYAETSGLSAAFSSNSLKAFLDNTSSWINPIKSFVFPSHNSLKAIPFPDLFKYSFNFWSCVFLYALTAVSCLSDMDMEQA